MKLLRVAVFALILSCNPASSYIHGLSTIGSGAQLVIEETDGSTWAFMNLMATWGMSISPTAPGYLSVDDTPADTAVVGAFSSDILGSMSFITGDSGYTGQFKQYWTGGTCAWKWPYGTGNLTVTTSGGGTVIQTSSYTIIYGPATSVFTLQFALLHSQINSVGYPAPADIGGGFQYSGCTGIVLCRSQNTPVDDCTAIATGGTTPSGIVNPDFVSANLPLGPSILRSLSWDGANLTSTALNYITQSKYRARLSSVGWISARWAGPNVWVGNITGTNNYSSPTFTDAPSSWPAFGSNNTTSPMWQGYFSNTNTSLFPTVQIAFGGTTLTKDLVGTFISSPVITMGGTSTSGDHLTIAFTLPSGSYNFVYTPGSTGLSATAMSAAISAQINSDTTLKAASISSTVNGQGCNGGTTCFGVDSRFSGTSFTTSVTGAVTETMTTSSSMPANTIKTDRASTMVYWPLIDKVIYAAGGINPAIPLEARVAVSNVLGAYTWKNFPTLYDDVSIVSDTTFYKANSSAGVINGYSNECWNFGNAQTSLAIAAGTIFGWPIGNGERYLGWCGYRSLAMFNLINSAWTPAFTSSTGLSQVELVLENMFVTSAVSGQQIWRWNGQDLNPNTYSTFCSYLGGTYTGTQPSGTCSVSGFSSYPNRPIDIATAVAYAPYWAGAVTQNSYAGTYAAGDTAPCSFLGTNSGGLFCAGQNFAAGFTTPAFTWLDDDFRFGTKNGVPANATLNVFACNGSGACNSATNPGPYITFESGGTQDASAGGVACYDGLGSSPCNNPRVSGINVKIIEYEGGPQFSWPTPANCTSMGFSLTETPTFNGTSPQVNWSSNTFQNGETISFSVSGGSLPSGISSGTIYYIQNNTGNAFDLSPTYYGPTITTITGSGSGTITATACQGGIANLIDGYKKSSYASQIMVDRFNQSQGLDPTQPTFGLLKHSRRPSQFLSNSGVNQTTPWGLGQGSIYVKPYFQFYNGFSRWKHSMRDPASNDNSPMFLGKVA